ncbi:MAG: Gfo/Idh/MocA family oxidoreductase [Geminicoccaceae bacterium]|nr:Gfo/Idh/MocA family oxidoreductase [Geminicoccaceae bacterium]
MKIGWIGCGRHASAMLLPQLAARDVTIEALCDVDAPNLERTARRYGVRAIYADARDLIGHAGLDAIGMAVGPVQHAAFGAAALERGLPIFMEKPPGATCADAQRLMRAAERAGKPLLIGFMKRYAVGNRIARNVIASGDFGRVLAITGRYMTAPGYFAGDVDHTGFFLHHCVHYLDLPAFFASPIRGLSARMVENGPGRLLFHMGLDFACGAIATIEMGTVQSRGGPVERLEITGDHQRLEIDDVIEVTWRRDPPLKAEALDAVLDPAHDALTWKPNFTAAAAEDPKGYGALLSDVLEALAGRPSSAPTIEDGVCAMHWLEELRRTLDR